MSLDVDYMKSAFDALMDYAMYQRAVLENQTQVMVQQAQLIARMIEEHVHARGAGAHASRVCNGVRAIATDR